MKAKLIKHTILLLILSLVFTFLSLILADGFITVPFGGISGLLFLVGAMFLFLLILYFACNAVFTKTSYTFLTLLALLCCYIAALMFFQYRYQAHMFDKSVLVAQCLTLCKDRYRKIYNKPCPQYVLKKMKTKYCLPMIEPFLACLNRMKRSHAGGCGWGLGLNNSYVDKLLIKFSNPAPN